jgi:hypothetical protein
MLIDTTRFHASALRDVKIPPGPRLLILDHIKRCEMADKNLCFLLFSLFLMLYPKFLYILQGS